MSAERSGDDMSEGDGASDLFAGAILIVDDDVHIRQSVAAVLQDEGYRVHAAGNGRDALDLLERIPRPALALVDLRMPVMDGVELIEVLRSDPRWTSLPVVAFSAASIVDAPTDVPLLRKPISITSLLAAVEIHAAAG